MTTTDPTASPNRPWLTDDIAWVNSGADIAAYLRAAADAFETVGDLPLCSINLGVQVSAHRGTVPSAERAAAVDILSAALGLTADPRRMSDGSWHYQAPFRSSSIRPFTAIDTPTCRFLGGGCAKEQAGEGDEGLCAEHIKQIWPAGRPVDGEVVENVRALPAVEEKADWLVWSLQHQAWWASNGNGYDTDPYAAARMTEAEATDPDVWDTTSTVAIQIPGDLMVGDPFIADVLAERVAAEIARRKSAEVSA